MCADLSARAEMVVVRVAVNIADDEEDLVLMVKPLDKLDAELLILTHPDISQVARIKARLIFFMRNSVQATRLHASTAKTAVKLQTMILFKELALCVTPLRRFPSDSGLEIFVRGYALPQADVNVLS